MPDGHGSLCAPDKLNWGTPKSWILLHDTQNHVQCPGPLLGLGVLQRGPCAEGALATIMPNSRVVVEGAVLSHAIALSLPSMLNCQLLLQECPPTPPSAPAPKTPNLAILRASFLPVEEPASPT